MLGLRESSGGSVREPIQVKCEVPDNISEHGHDRDRMRVIQLGSEPLRGVREAAKEPLVEDGREVVAQLEEGVHGQRRVVRFIVLRIELGGLGHKENWLFILRAKKKKFKDSGNT